MPEIDPNTSVPEQDSPYAKAVGQSSPERVIGELYDYARTAHVHEFWSQYPDVPFMYQKLHREGWVPKVRELVDLWLENKDNVKRVARYVGRQPVFENQQLLKAFCMFELKRNEPQHWRLTEGLGSDAEEPQTVIFIALEDLDEDNGFFMSLQKGQDVCLDSKASVKIPPTGGGLGIFIALRM